jgi:hypothetical protein
MEPYWNYGRIAQIKFRGIRNDSHKLLPPDERNVQVYIYLAIAPSSAVVKEQSTDEELYEKSMLNKLVIDSYEKAIQEVSIECALAPDAAARNCRTCAPTDEPLFTNNIARDCSLADPCRQVQTLKLAAEKIEYEGETYYYIVDPKSVYGYRFFKFSKDLNGYQQLPMDAPINATLADLLEK